MLCVILFSCAAARCQPAANAQQLAFAGLRSVAAQGQINGVQSDSSGNIFLLLDQKDGVRLLKTDNAASTILAQAQLGAAGDTGVALALDPAGNVYVTGTSSSGALTGTPGAAIPTPTDSSTQSFIAKFDPSLNPLFVSFTGGSRIAAAALAATADAVFVTGITYATNLPVTPNGIQQAPAYGSSQNGFVEKFSSSGSVLLYATYLTGASGDTTPAAIAADAADNSIIAGFTTASGFPTVAALVPDILSNPSGFLTRLDPGGDAITASTFIPGPGLTSIALDSSGQTLLVSGSVALGQFPVDTVAMPLVTTNYQVLLRLPLDLSAVQSGTLLAPGSQSFVAAAANGASWIDGTLAAPLLPLVTLQNFGNAFAVRVNSANAVDQTARFGGLPSANPAYASLPAVPTSIAVDPTGEALIAGAIQPTASAALLATQTYDLPLRQGPTPPFPSAVRDSEQSAATCTGSLCAGSAAYLAKLDPIPVAALAFSADTLPFVTLRNLGTSAADTLQLTVSAGTLSSTCPSTLYPGGECGILLSGGSPGTLTASSSDAAAQSVSFPAYPATPPAQTLVFYPKELDFGIQTSTSPPSSRTITVSNLGAASQTFTSALDAFSNNRVSAASPFSELGSDCALAGAQTTKLLAPGATCHITLGFTALASSASDGLLQANWSIGSQDVLLTGWTQAASLGVSAAEIDFGTQFINGLRLPRFLYLSNASTAAIAHASLALPAGSPFTLTDACPSTLPPATVCRIRIDYLASQAPSTASVTLTLDQGLSVLLTGQTLPPHTVGGATVNPNLSVTPASITFSTPVPVTGVSATSQTVAISNSGTAPFTLALAITGDFTPVTSCGATLAGGATCAVSLSFAPAQPGTRTGLLSVTAGAGTSPAYVTLSGTGIAILAANNGTLDSGSVPIGQPVTTFYKISQPFNALTASSTGPYTLSLVEDVGYGPGQPPASAFAASITGSCHNCYLGIRFQPVAAGPQPGSLTLSSTPGGTPYAVSLNGIGLPLTGLLLTPLAQDFGTVPVNSSSGSFFFTLTNVSSTAAPVPVSSPVLTGDFTLSSSPTGGNPCGGTLAYTASCIVAVTFTPTASGSRTGTLTFSGTGVSATAQLTGSATPDPGVALNPLALTFSNSPGPTATTQTITLTDTGGYPIQIGPPATATADFRSSTSCATLGPGASCSITVTFLPAPATVSDTLSIPVTTSSPGTPPLSTTYMVALNGAYTSASQGIQILPAQSEYGPVPTGTESQSRLFTITNLTARQLTLNVTIPRQFVLLGPACISLAPSGSCSFSVAFLPLTNGDIPGTLFATATPTDGSPSLSGLAYVEGFGTGTGMLNLTGGLIVQGVFNFGQVQSGQQLTQNFTLTNAGSSAITVRRISSGPPFLSTSNCGAPLTPAQTCTVTVTYTPSNQGSGTAASVSTSDSGTLTIESDAASSPNILSLTGQAGPAAASSNSSGTLATYTLSQGSLTFASTMVGDASPAQTITLTNTGSVALQVVATTAPADFTTQNTCASVLPAATCTITVTSTPQIAGTHIASLEIASGSATSLEFVSLLSGATPPALTLSPASLNFGSVVVGSSATLPVQVTNTTAAPVTFSSISASGDFTAGGSCPAPGSNLAANSSCTVQVTFTPIAAGTRSGALSISTSASTLPLNAPLAGVGTQSQLVITPSALAFGSIAVGASANISLTLQNNGSATVSNLALTITGDYAITIPCALASLAPGISCTAQVTFTPGATGPRPGTLTVTSSDPSSPAHVPLTGTGVQGGGSFTLSVDGGSSSAITVPSGAPATYHLTLTPIGGYTGSVALTCAPIVPGPYASCSLLPASVQLAGTPQLALATINTVTSINGNAALASPPGRPLAAPFLCLLAPGMFVLWRGRRNLRRHRPLLLAMLLASLSLSISGCGGGANPNLRYTPPGSYQYQVTATSTNGVQTTQTVTLNLVVTAR